MTRRYTVAHLVADLFSISVSEARRLIRGGGIYINDVRWTAPDREWPYGRPVRCAS